MRGQEGQQANLFSYISLEDRVSKSHPIRTIRKIVDKAIDGMESYLDYLYSDQGRPSIAPERLIRALSLQILYSVPSERQLMERINYDLLFRWLLVWISMIPYGTPLRLQKNRNRLLQADLA